MRIFETTGKGISPGKLKPYTDSLFSQIPKALSLVLAAALLWSCSPAAVSNPDNSGAVNAANLVDKNKDKRFSLNSRARFFVDGNNSLTIKDIIQEKESGMFKHNAHTIPNFGFQDSTVWVTFHMESSLETSLKRVLEIANPLLDTITLYRVEGDKIIDERHSGRLMPFGKREFPHHYFIFNLEFPPGQNTDYFLKINSQSSLEIPLTLMSARTFAVSDHYSQYVFGIYYGLIAVMILYNLFLFFSVRDKSYLFYVFTLITLHGFFQLSLNGFLMEIMDTMVALKSPWWSVWWARDSLTFFLGLGILSALLFSANFLGTKNHTPRMHLAIQVMIVLSISVVPLSFFKVYLFTIRYAIVIAIAAIGLGAGLGIYYIKTGHRSARFFLAAWSLLLIGGILYAFKALGLIPSNFMTDFSLQIGSAMEAVILSLALGDRYNIMRQEQFHAQKEVYQRELEAKKSQEEMIGHLKNLEKFRDEIMAIDSDSSLEVLLDKILSTLNNKLIFTRAFIVILDRSEKMHLKSTDELHPALKETLYNQNLITKFTKVSEELFPYLNVTYTLQRNLKETFKYAPNSIKRQHKETIKSVVDLIEVMIKHGYELCVPLAYRKEIFGYLILGEKETGQEYTRNEISLLETFRFSMALAIRNATLYKEIKDFHGKAEAKVNKLSEYISSINEVIKHKMQDKTLVYSSKDMTAVYEKSYKYAEQIQPILVTGSTGTGKELIAQMIHETRYKENKNAPFVPVNCAAIPGNLWESEIFGYEKGAFTDASRSHGGRVEQAANGTLFFDEIGEMPLEIQPKLLRLIQERTFSRIGGKKSLDAECRFIFATNRNLLEEVQRGSFREDLYYRISVLEIKIPELRQRRDDIPSLINHFIQKYATELKSEVKTIDSAALDTLCRYTWPGNIRELENTIIHSVIHASGEEITTKDLPPQFSAFSGQAMGGQEQTVDMGSLESKSLEEAVRDFTRSMIQKTIERVGGSKLEAARLLKVKRATFYKRLKELGIK